MLALRPGEVVPLNRTGVEWAQWSWNPITGCLNGCDYCYAARMAKRLHGRAGYPDDEPFAPTLHSDRLQEPSRLRRPSVIFLESMGELWGYWVPKDWQDAILKVVRENPRHIFLNPTKNPGGLFWHEGPLPENLWVGLSLDTVDRVDDLETFGQVEHETKFLSCEPLLEDVTTSPRWSLDGIRWLIVGAQTGPGAQPIDRAVLAKLISQARSHDIPLFIKDNVGMENPPQEFPAEIRMVGRMTF